MMGRSRQNAATVAAGFLLLAASLGMTGASAAPPEKRHYLVNVKGVGEYTSKPIDASAMGWRIWYKFDCTNYDDPSTAYFEVLAGDPQRPLAAEAPAIVKLMVKHKGLSAKLNGGQWYLHVKTWGDCSWHIKAYNLQ